MFEKILLIKFYFIRILFFFTIKVKHFKREYFRFVFSKTHKLLHKYCTLHVGYLRMNSGRFIYAYPLTGVAKPILNNFGFNKEKLTRVELEPAGDLLMNVPALYQLNFSPLCWQSTHSSFVNLTKNLD